MEESQETSLKIMAQLQATQLPISAVLLEEEVTVEQLLQLNPGNVLRFNKPLTTPVTLVVHNRKIALGSVVQCGDRYGIQIEQFCQNND